MRVLILFPALLFLLSHPNCPAQQTTTSGETQTKKVIGPFDLVLGSRREESLGEIRAFLWQNLNGHQLAEVKAKFYTIEGDPTEWTFSVVGSGGRWCIRGDYVSTTYFGLKPGQKPQISKGTKDFYHVLRVDARTNVAVPKGEQRKPEAYRLILDGARGLEL